MEYKLVKGGSTGDKQEPNLQFHVMKLNSASVKSAQDLTPPVKLYRNYPLYHAQMLAKKQQEQQGETKPDEEQQQPAAEKKRFQPKRNKTKLYYNNSFDYQETRQQASALRRRERMPWILEDAHGEQSFVGTFQQQESSYVLLTFENGQFSATPVENWYKFNPRISYRTLTTDEAESQMKKSGVSMDRWVMHRLNGGDGSSAGPGAKTRPVTGQRMRVVDRSGASGEQDVDENLFGGHFDDDEEYGHDLGEDLLEDDEEMQRRRQELEAKADMDYLDKLKLHAESRKTTKLLKKWNQDFLSDDEEEVKDPYSDLFGDDQSSTSSSGEESDTKMDVDDEKKPKSIIQKPISAPPSRSSSPALKLPTAAAAKQLSRIQSSSSNSGASSPTSSVASSRTAGKKPLQPTTKRSKPTQQERQQKKLKQDDAGDDGSITEAEVRKLFEEAPQNRLQIKELIEKLGKRVKERDNLAILKSILKKVGGKDQEGFMFLKK